MFKKVSIILIIIGVFLFAETYKDPNLKCVLTGPSDWNMETINDEYKVVFSPEGSLQDVFVGLSTHVASIVITANQVQLIRAGSHWDRMKILGLKHTDKTTLSKENVDEKLTALYLSSEIGDDGVLVDTYVAEDIYIKEGYIIYIVTAKAVGDNWFKYKDTIREIMKSFTVDGNPLY